MASSKKSVINGMDVFISKGYDISDSYSYQGESMSLDFGDSSFGEDTISITPLDSDSLSGIDSITSTTLGRSITGGLYDPNTITWGGTNVTLAPSTFTGTGGGGGTGGFGYGAAIPGGYGAQSTWDTVTGRSHDIKIHGDAEFSGKVSIGGKDIGALLESIEERLAILHPNPELEERWETLKQLGKQYRELEADIKEKEQIWATLKK